MALSKKREGAAFADRAALYGLWGPLSDEQTLWLDLNKSLAMWRKAKIAILAQQKTRPLEYYTLDAESEQAARIAKDEADCRSALWNR